MSERYAAFISYSHSDEGVARWLHRAIEGFRFPKGLRGEASEFGPVPARLPPVFRDRDELPASGDLGSELRAALAASRFQIVLCSPRAAQSKWVNEEILAFKRTHGEHRTLAVIVEGEPYSGGAEECFPEALRFKLAADGSLAGEPAEPIAADIRKGKDGKRLALLKLLAGISGTRLDQLVRRDAARRQRRLAFVAAGSGLVALTTIGLAIYAEGQRRVAVEQREAAQSSLDFLIGTFEIANPATENPKTITALTILDRASDRAVHEFATRPAMAGNLLRATGQIYYNLGLTAEAEDDLKRALALEPLGSEGRAVTLLQLAGVAKRKQDAGEAERWLKRAMEARTPDQKRNREFSANVTEQEGNVAFLRGDFDLAATLFARAISRFENLPIDRRADIVRNLANEANALYFKGDLKRTNQSLSRAAELSLALYGPNDVRTAEAQNNKAVALFNLGSFREARKVALQALTAMRRILDPHHPSLATAYLLLGRISAADENYQESRIQFAKARELGTTIYGADNPFVGDVDYYAADMEADAGRYAEAIRLAGSVQRIYDQAYGPDDPDQAEVLLLRSRILTKSGDQQAAQLACLKAAELQRRLALPAAVVSETEASCRK